MVIHPRIKSLRRVVCVILGAVIACGVGYVVWQYVAHRELVSSSVTSSDAHSTFLMLSDWGIKFTTPNSLGVIKVYPQKASSNDEGISEYYELTTKRVEALGGQCVGSTSSGGVIRLVLIYRTQAKVTDSSIYTPAIGNQPLKGYYYYERAGTSVCSKDHIRIQTDDRQALSKMLQRPIAI